MKIIWGKRIRKVHFGWWMFQSSWEKKCISQIIIILVNYTSVLSYLHSSELVWAPLREKLYSCIIQSSVLEMAWEELWKELSACRKTSSLYSYLLKRKWAQRSYKSPEGICIGSNFTINACLVLDFIQIHTNCECDHQMDEKDTNFKVVSLRFI